MIHHILKLFQTIEQFFKWAIIHHIFIIVSDDRARVNRQEGPRVVPLEPDHGRRVEERQRRRRREAAEVVEGQPGRDPGQSEADVRISGHLHGGLRVQRSDEVIKTVSNFGFISVDFHQFIAN